MPTGPFALDTRLALIQRAERSIDVQYYVLQNDATGRYLLRSLEQLGATMALLPSLLTVGGRAAQAHAEHEVMLAALRARDGDAAEAAARAHAQASQRHRLAWLVRTVGVPYAAPGGG